MSIYLYQPDLYHWIFLTGRALIQNMTINSVLRKAFSLTQQFNDTLYWQHFSPCLHFPLILNAWHGILYRSGLWMMYSNAILVSRAVFDIFTNKDGDLFIPQIFILRNHWISLLWCEVMLEPKDRITFLIKQLPAEWLLNFNSTQYSRKYSGIVKGIFWGQHKLSFMDSRLWHAGGYLRK